MPSVRRLVAEGAAIEAKDRNGETPLIIAAEDSNVEALRFLLDKGANVVARDNQNETALIHAARSFDPTALEILLPRVSDTKEKNEALIMAAAGGPVIMQAADSEPDQARAKPATETPELPWVRAVRILLDSGADIEAKNEEGSTPLLTAAAYGQTETFNFLLQRGSNIRARDKRGATALINAACQCAQATMRGTYDIMKALLDAGANVNAKERDGATALMVASGMSGDVAVLELLLSQGADLFARDKKGRTALKIALQSQREDKIRLLKRATSKLH